MTLIYEPDKLQAALTIIADAAGNECPGCEANEPLWRGSDQPDLTLHGDGDEVMDCESPIMADAVKAGLFTVKVYPRCAKGHEWYGEGCPECEEEAP